MTSTVRLASVLAPDVTVAWPGASMISIVSGSPSLQLSVSSRATPGRSLTPGAPAAHAGAAFAAADTMTSWVTGGDGPSAVMTRYEKASGPSYPAGGRYRSVVAMSRAMRTVPCWGAAVISYVAE